MNSAGRTVYQTGYQTGARRLGMATLFSLAIAFAAAAQGSTAGGAAARIDVSLDGETYRVRASAQLAADQRVVWDTLTDYERLREFIPGTLSALRLGPRAGVRLDYDAQFELTRPLPALIGPLFGVAAVRRTMHAQFEAMLREIERRQALLDVAEERAE